VLDFTFCPRCSAPLAQRVAFGRERRVCRYCGYIQFKDPKVAVSALVTAAGTVLLVRRAVVPRIGFWALPAGYMDADELPEETVMREVLEETGLRVRCLGLHALFPLGGWHERRGILLVYHADYLSGEAVAADDASEVRWFEPRDIPWGDLAFESTAQLLREWVASLPPSSAP
jgi:8-oxo-dGTP diphosphatase